MKKVILRYNQEYSDTSKVLDISVSEEKDKLEMAKKELSNILTQILRSRTNLKFNSIENII